MKRCEKRRPPKENNLEIGDVRENMKRVDSPVPGETGFAFHGAGKPGNDGLGI
jgi:hypothetical protein